MKKFPMHKDRNMKSPSVELVHKELDIHKRVRKYYSIFISRMSPETIWEIGALDGLDSVSLKNKFPTSNFYAFEPTPESFKIVEKNLKLIKGKAFEFALSDMDGTATFRVNDPKKTITTWANGNQGANSLFRANPEYPIEKYVQKSINVKTLRADTFINGGNLIPELVWIDVQGAEMMVFTGFGDYLEYLNFIYVELSLFPLYTGSPLAHEVVQYLSNRGFYWVKNLTLGGFQFDAVFVRPNKLKNLAKLKHKIFTHMLNTQDKLFISMSVTQFIRTKARKLLKISFRIFKQ